MFFTDVEKKKRNTCNLNEQYKGTGLQMHSTSNNAI